MAKTAEQEAWEKYLDEVFPIVEVSKLSLEDEFLQHKPENKRQKRLKKSIIKCIESNLPNFRHPIMDPSDEFGEGFITFEEISLPAYGHSAVWWDFHSKGILPQKKSSLGNPRQYDAFLGLLIKYLVEEEKWDIKEAWKAVCDDSRELGHYTNSEGSKDDLEYTGSRKVGKWHDLANSYKILKSECGKFVMASGSYETYSDDCPLAELSNVMYSEATSYDQIGWIVIEV